MTLLGSKEFLSFFELRVLDDCATECDVRGYSKGLDVPSRKIFCSELAFVNRSNVKLLGIWFSEAL